MAKMLELRLGTETDNSISGGLCLENDTTIDIKQSPEMLNMLIDNGVLSKRKGQMYYFTSDVSTSKVNAIYCDFLGENILHIGTSLYKFTGNNTPTLLGTGLQNIRSSIFVYNNILYIMDGVSYKQYDGTTFTDVVPYCPIVNMNRKPDGSSSVVNESWNMLGNGFRNTFNADGSTKIYKLSLTSLDSSTAPIVKVGGVLKTITTDYTVDYVAGTITFTTAPATGDNNVEITAYKVFANLKENIKGCRFACEFSNRVFISGNPNLKNTYYAGGLNEDIKANYFPQKYTYIVGGKNKAITGLKVHQNKLIVFKEDMICTIESSLGLDNTASFPISFLDTDKGCDIPYSIQLIDNNIVFANSVNGVYMITSTSIPGEKSILPISINVNGSEKRIGLLQEQYIKEAISVDHNYKYYLCLPNGRCYVLDYKYGISTKSQEKNSWFLFDNIKANCFTIMGAELIYGSSEKGNLVRFISAKRDFNLPINAYWKSKLFDFGYPDWLKYITNCWITFDVIGLKSDVKISYLNEKGFKETDNVILGKKTYGWDRFSWDNFSWVVSIFDSTNRKKVRAKKISYFQIELENNVLDEDLSVKNIVVQYRLMRKVR